MFKFFYRPPEFFPRGKFLLKITILGDFWDRKATFLKLQWWNLAWECSRDTPSPRQNFVKSCKGIYPFWGKFIPIITIFGNILGRKPTFLKPQWWYLAWGCGLGTPSTTPNYTPFGQIYTKNLKFWRVWATSAHISYLWCWNLNEPGKH